MNTTIWMAITVIFTVTIGWTSASVAMCNSNEEEIAVIKKLYEYAQIAEAPKSDNLQYMENCVGENGSVIANKPDDIIDLFIPNEFIDLVIARADNDRAILQPSKQRRDGVILPFTVGCSVERGSQNIVINFSFKLLARIIGNRALFYLTGTEVKGTVVVRSSGEPIAIIPGTHFLQLPEVRANFEGEECAFPVVKTTVGVLCKVLQNRKGTVYRALVERNGNKAFVPDLQSITMIGHSLGGSATQYVASNIPDQCVPEGNFLGFDGYSFAGPGLESRESQGDTGHKAKCLRSYLIDGDWLLQRAFLDRFQYGRIAVYSPPKGQIFCPGHFIDEVQNALCMYLQGTGKMDYSKGGVKNSRLLLTERCSVEAHQRSPQLAE